MKTMNETLKASDLMVGDYVKWEYVTYPDVVVNNGYKKVDAIYGDESVDLIDEDTLYEHVPMDEIKAVELTTEILEKNGWKHEFDKTEYMVKYDLAVEGEHCWMMWSIKYHNLDIQRQDEHLDMYNLCIYHVVIPCDYVYQLQHALRMCGIKKEITI